MRIKLTKYEFKNGDVSIETDHDHSPYSPVIKEYEQVIEIDESKFVSVSGDEQ